MLTDIPIRGCLMAAPCKEEGRKVRVPAVRGLMSTYNLRRQRPSCRKVQQTLQGRGSPWALHI